MSYDVLHPSHTGVRCLGLFSAKVLLLFVFPTKCLPSLYALP
jgi:hypothetical protein